jgi:hypothetical protein
MFSFLRILSSFSSVNASLNETKARSGISLNKLVITSKSCKEIIPTVSINSFLNISALRGFTFPVYFDTDGDASYTYQAYSLPTSVFIDADGYIVAYQPGLLTPDMMQKGIELILKASPNTNSP